MQWKMTANSFNQIRFEELSESVRNVYFLDKRQIFDGISSNVGWYGTILLFYKLFGFNLFLAKFYKLFLLVISLLSLDQIFKYFKIKYYWFLLLIFSLSPTLLFFNTLAAGFGIDLLLFPIAVYLLIIWRQLKKTVTKYFLVFLIWFFIMFSSMSYGTFLAYLPLLGLLFFYFLYTQSSNWKEKLAQIIISISGFFLPLLLALNYLNQPKLLIFDPSNNSGIFRGGGVGEKVTSIQILFSHLKLSLSIFYQDLFISGQSYYYEPLRVELSHRIFPLIILILIICSIFIFLTIKKSRILLASGYLLILVGILVGGFSDWFPGIRRMTPVMMGFFLMIIGMWQAVPLMLNKKLMNKVIGVTIVSCLGLIILHHLKVYPENLAGLTQDSKHQAGKCFHLLDKNSNQSINYYASQTIEGKIIEVDDECRLHELYPAIMGACEWNGLDCQEIKFSQEKEFKKPI